MLLPLGLKSVINEPDPGYDLGLPASTYNFKLFEGTNGSNFPTTQLLVRPVKAKP